MGVSDIRCETRAEEDRLNDPNDPPLDVSGTFSSSRAARASDETPESAIGSVNAAADAAPAGVWLSGKAGTGVEDMDAELDPLSEPTSSCTGRPVRCCSSGALHCRKWNIVAQVNVIERKERKRPANSRAF